MVTHCGHVFAYEALREYIINGPVGSRDRCGHCRLNLWEVNLRREVVQTDKGSLVRETPHAGSYTGIILKLPPHLGLRSTTEMPYADLDKLNTAIGRATLRAAGSDDPHPLCQVAGCTNRDGIHWQCSRCNSTKICNECLLREILVDDAAAPTTYAATRVTIPVGFKYDRPGWMEMRLFGSCR